MEVPGSSEEGFVREWTPCSHVMNLIPARIQTGLFSSELCLTCVDAVNEYIALGTNVGLVYWYDRKKGNIQRLRCEASNSPITFVKIVSTVDYMVGAGNAAGQVTVFQIPKQHPDNIPDNFKPKIEPKVERYTIGDLHKSKITAIEWSKNGMRLFSGDKDGVIIMTEIDFYMHLCKSMEIVNERHSIVQLSYHGSSLLVSSLYRSILCERRDSKWHVSQLGTRERKSLCALGAVFQYSYASGGAAQLYCARPGLRLWRADARGEVLQTLLFKEAISNPLTVAELLNPAANRHSHSSSDYQLGPLYVFREHFLVSHNQSFLYILEPRAMTAVAVVDQLRRILSVCVNKDEMFVLEGPRSLVRLAHAPEPAACAPDEPYPMSKSLTTSLQHAASAVRDHTAPYIATLLEQPIAMFTNNETTDHSVASAEECFELPPIQQLPKDISGNVLQSIVNEFKDTSNDVNETSEELKRKLKLYNSIMEKKYGEELIHSRSRSRRREGSGGSTPRLATPVRRGEGVYTSPCVMNVSVFDNLPQQNDELLEKQIEEKEKILAKMLNLESLSIAPTNITQTHTYDTPTHTPVHKHVEIQEKSDPEKNYTQENVYLEMDKEKKIKEENYKEEKSKQGINTLKSVAKTKASNSIDLIPSVMKLPNNWNLDNMELKLDLKLNGFKDNRVILSPDENLDSEWEIV